MMQPLTIEEFQMLATEAKRIAVFKTVSASTLTPIIIYSILSRFYKADGVMLEDLHQRDCPRYSFMCFEPIDSLKINTGDHEDPLSALREFQSKQVYSTRPQVAELITSSMGFMAYDVVRSIEDIPDRHPLDPSLPILFFSAYTVSLTFDHEKQTILISIVVEVGDLPEAAYHQAQQKIIEITELLYTAAEEGELPILPIEQPCVAVEPSDLDFMRMVEKAKDYIIRGDAFQIVLSRCFRRHYTASPLAIYKALRQVSPAPFMFYFPTEASVMIGASPERLIRVHDQQVTVNPIAGTRKATGDRAKITADLLSDKKELAEHMMLVDLARNDVGAVSEPGSVRVSELLCVKHYSHTSHITSTVTGTLQKKKDALDAFAAAFPAGTLSGAPKIRAMHIIDELETSRRGLYGGAIGRFDSLGNFDSCIAIRMATLQNGIATIRTGAGIVYDSHSAAEAQETYQKAQSMLDAIAHAQGE